ncbi:MAG: hypothetical protein COT84_00800 [Chlamydiae bacterium CG10_big_fil_rev_8_21_14_0_10_35_9]|nr:MAG: hypothetical protein COT84_00800 [Chlamydiae bacterium CG10_big_fil_rev_8_21_14_0_10_35_9]
MQNIRMTAILLMAGIGSRFQSALPKQYHNLSGKKVYLHTLDTFVKSNLFYEIILVCDKDFIATVCKEVAHYPNCKVIEGGKTRQESSYLGLLACHANSNFVMIHDAVRPFVSLRILQENFEQVLKHKAVDTCISSADTLVHTQNGSHIDDIPLRSAYLRGQTPQSFCYKLICKAHEHALNAKQENASDDCQLVHNLGHKIAIVRGDERNIKITTSLDLFLAEQMFRLPIKQEITPNTSIRGKKYIVIGSNGGMGREICRQLEQAGAIVIPLARKKTAITIDLNDTKSMEIAFQSIHGQYGMVDGLINAAGILIKKPLDKITLTEITKILQVNLTGVILSCKMAKIKAQGHIINISSSSYFKGRKNYGIYSSTKAALVNFTQSLADEKKDLCVNVIVPQRTDTKMRRMHFSAKENENLLDPKTIAVKVLKILKVKNLSGEIIEIRAQ